MIDLEEKQPSLFFFFVRFLSEKVLPAAPNAGSGPMFDRSGHMLCHSTAHERQTWYASMQSLFCQHKGDTKSCGLLSKIANSIKLKKHQDIDTVTTQSRCRRGCDKNSVMIHRNERGDGTLFIDDRRQFCFFSHFKRFLVESR